MASGRRSTRPPAEPGRLALAISARERGGRSGCGGAGDKPCDGLGAPGTVPLCPPTLPLPPSPLPPFRPVPGRCGTLANIRRWLWGEGGGGHGWRPGFSLTREEAAAAAINYVPYLTF